MVKIHSSLAFVIFRLNVCCWLQLQIADFCLVSPARGSSKCWQMKHNFMKEVTEPMVKIYSSLALAIFRLNVCRWLELQIADFSVLSPARGSSKCCQLKHNYMKQVTEPMVKIYSSLALAIFCWIVCCLLLLQIAKFSVLSPARDSSSCWHMKHNYIRQVPEPMV